MKTYDWKNNPMGSFKLFIRSNDFSKTGRGNLTSWPLKEKSISVYSFMFARYLRWLESENVQIDKLSTPKAEQFFSSLDETTKSEIKWRYIRLLERVYDHLFELDIVTKNPISEILLGNKYSRDKVVTYRNAETAAILDSQKIILMQHLFELSSSKSIKNRRDAALTAILLSGGLKLSEALALKRKDFVFKKDSTYLKINSAGTNKPRIIRIDTLIDNEIITILTSWINECRDYEFIFYGASKSQLPMNSATAYRRISRIIENSKVTVEHTGGRVLRNSFAIFQIRSGMDKEEICEIMGIREERSLNIYIQTAKREVSLN